MASYTFLDAEVTESFSGGVLAPAINPAFPGIPIGQYSPLVGERPFRRPTHSGSFMVGYLEGPFDVALSAYLSGRRDGSTFLSDGFFGYSLLLPNQDLEAGYQKVDLAAGYRPAPERARVRQHGEPARQGLSGVLRVPGAADHGALGRDAERRRAVAQFSNQSTVGQK